MAHLPVLAVPAATRIVFILLGVDREVCCKAWHGTAGYAFVKLRLEGVG